MDTRLSRVLGATGGETLDRVAAGASGIAGAICDGPPRFEELTTTRADRRTLGIVRVSGGARQAEGAAALPWTAVVKIVDLGQGGGSEQQWTRPETEEIVYEEGYFANDGQRFRPAQCYAVTRPEASLKVFWLEDLTGAGTAPFGIDQLAIMARHLGEWSGAHEAVPALKFQLPRDLYAARWATPAYAARYERLLALDPAKVQPWYGDLDLDIIAELRALLMAQNERARGLPHGLAFGDCQVGNLFHRPHETIAVDWATLTVDPVGADGGAMIGSMLGRAGLLEIARNERALFDCYVEGLSAAGWRGNRDDVRRAYFCQYGHYLATTVAFLPVVHANVEWPKQEMEYRLQADWESFPQLYAPVIAMYPAYIAELRALAAR